MRREPNAVGGWRATPTRASWDAMIQRCTNPKREKYATYGARGIKVCDRWKRFANFLADMGERPEGTTIDRIDNSLGYEPSNCRWATRKQQHANRSGIDVDITGSTFAGLTVMARAGSFKGRRMWHCVCACGRKVAMRGTVLRNGRALSCGCQTSNVQLVRRM
jgi:hypothetical protein